MISVSITFRGVPAVEAGFQRERTRVHQGVAAVLTAVAEHIIERAQRETIPMETMALASSGEVDKPVFTPGGVSVTMAFGRSGKSAAYALAVHEHLSEHSPPSWVAAEGNGRPVRFTPSGTGPKYLERPFMEESARLPEYLRAARVAG